MNLYEDLFQISKLLLAEEEDVGDDRERRSALERYPQKLLARHRVNPAVPLGTLAEA
jgi:hypothetical protein